MGDRREPASVRTDGATPHQHVTANLLWQTTDKVSHGATPLGGTFHRLLPMADRLTKVNRRMFAPEPGDNGAGRRSGERSPSEEHKPHRHPNRQPCDEHGHLPSQASFIAQNDSTRKPLIHKTAISDFFLKIFFSALRSLCAGTEQSDWPSVLRLLGNGLDLPPNFHPARCRVSAKFAPCGAGWAMGLGPEPGTGVGSGPIALSLAA